MRRERSVWIAVCVAISFVALFQTYRLNSVRKDVEHWRKETTWPARALPIDVAESAPAVFKRGMRPTIPEEFWGEFAADVHDCGGEGTMIIAGDRITVGSGEREAIERIDWLAPLKFEVWSNPSSGYSRQYRVEASQDRAELTFAYTNRKEIFQRCSARAHGTVETLTNASSSAGVSDEAMAADANMAIDADMTIEEDLNLTSN